MTSVRSTARMSRPRERAGREEVDRLFVEIRLPAMPDVRQPVVNELVGGPSPIPQQPRDRVTADADRYVGVDDPVHEDDGDAPPLVLGYPIGITEFGESRFDDRPRDHVR